MRAALPSDADARAERAARAERRDEEQRRRAEEPRADVARLAAAADARAELLVDRLQPLGALRGEALAVGRPRDSAHRRRVGRDGDRLAVRAEAEADDALWRPERDGVDADAGGARLLGRLQRCQHAAV